MSERPPFPGFDVPKSTGESTNRAATPLFQSTPGSFLNPTFGSPAPTTSGFTFAFPAPRAYRNMFGSRTPTSGSSIETPTPVTSMVVGQPSTPIPPRASSTPTLDPNAIDGVWSADAAVQHVDSELSLFMRSGSNVQASQSFSFLAMAAQRPPWKSKRWGPRQILEPQPATSQILGQPIKEPQPAPTVLIPAVRPTTAPVPIIPQPVATSNANGMRLIESGQASRSIPSTEALAGSAGPGWLKTQLLKGPGVMIIVGPRVNFSLSQHGRSWCLPGALVSHFSIVLRDACTRPMFEDQLSRITLPEICPKIFKLFVEWMYVGYYTTGLQFSPTGNTSGNLDAQAWVLGDKIRSLQFKNYAMTRLYESTVCIAPKQIRPEDIKHACKNSAVGSKLRLFLFDYLNAHFANAFRIDGTTEEWDQVLLEHADARSCLLQGLRMAASQRQTIRGKEAYLETEQEETATHFSANREQSTVPAKRGADGVPVKNERAET